jgi:phosphate ABC transporter phosphate-binding protein
MVGYETLYLPVKVKEMSTGRRAGGKLPGSIRWPRFCVALAVALAACCCGPVMMAEPSTPTSGAAKRVFVDTFQGKLGAAQLRERVVARLRSSGEVKVVDSAADADIVVHGTGETWLKGYVSINPHPTASVRQPVYGGYLSLEVAKKSGEMLWSYLVTPGRMHWSGVDQDMADHIVRLMLAALKQSDPETAQPFSSAAGQLALSGAGSTFSAPLYQAWIASFEDRHPEIHATYQAIGSESGLRMLEEGKLDFAASDVPLSDEDMARTVRFKQYATVLGGVVPAYNLAGAGRDLKFTPEVLAAIYLGKITRWNDVKLRAINRGVSLPDAPIVVLHRSDGSGTSFAWTEFLSKTSTEWKAGPGGGMTVAWPCGEGIAGNEAVAARIGGTPGAIGYIELTYAIRHELSFGLVRNAAGKFVQANLTSLALAANTASSNGDLRTSLIDAAGRDAYPIATFTWILVPPSADAKKSAALRDLIEWMLTSGQKECAGLGYVPLPRDLAEKELSRMRTENSGIARNAVREKMRDSTAAAAAMAAMAAD